MIRRNTTFLMVLFVVLTLLPIGIKNVRALTAEEIRRNIEQKNMQIDSLNKEIKKLDEQIQATNQEGKNLQGAINILDSSGKKLDKELTVTKEKINTTNLTIQGLENEIKKGEEGIQTNLDAISNSIKTMRETDDFSIIESILTNKNLSDVWDNIESINKFQGAAKESAMEIREIKKQLELRRNETEQKKKTLLTLNSELNDKKEIVENNKNEKEVLLTVTKNKEQNYKKILDEKKRLSDAFEKELESFESQLRLIIDPNSYPTSGKGVLAWPLENVFVTQYFGETEFSKTNAYNGKGHNGIDLRATRGTPVLSAQNGVVQGTGNTSAVNGCYSYGKWILIRHDNGLSTLYAHLDLIKVNSGQRVNLGEIIGYSGNTGYATGPHLHFGVYASQGVQIVTLKSGQSKNCTGAILPVADTKAYLNPIIYL